MEFNSFQKEINEYRNKFYDIYNESILPIFKEYEPERKKRLLMFCLVLLICLCIIIPVFIHLLLFNKDSLLKEIEGYVIVIVGLIAICAPLFMCYSFASDIKNDCLKNILKALGNIQRREESYITEHELMQSELFDTNLSISCDDSFLGTYRDVNFKVSELLLSGDAAKTIFKGVILSFKSNKTINNKTIVTSKSDKSLRKNSKPFLWEILFIIIFLVFTGICCFVIFSNVVEGEAKILFIGLGGFSLYFIYACIVGIIDKCKKVSTIIKKENLKQLKLEDIEFNKKYLAYSSDEVEGRYLLTPAFMERVKNLQTTFGSNKIKCSFYNDNIMFAISTRKNVFEIGSLFCPLTDPKTMDKFFNEIISIYLMISYFKLDEKTKL